LNRVVRNLDGGDAARLHHLLQLSERRRLIVSRPDRGNLSVVLQLLEHGELRAPIDQVVHLIEIDVATKKSQCGLRLAAALFTIGPKEGPYLRRDHDPVTLVLDRQSQHAFRLAVHR
jgi:hypothetical protein